MLRSPLGRLRVIGVVEGASFLLLLGVAMPLKYAFGRPEMVSVVGAAHGGLWIAYLASVLDVRLSLGWSWLKVMRAIVASIVPFGPFMLEPRLREEQRGRELASGKREPVVAG
jgi:integral membrane protein